MCRRDGGPGYRAASASRTVACAAGLEQAIAHTVTVQLDRRVLTTKAGLRSATVVAAADVIALGLLSRLHATGHRVPEDFRVIGFDGVGVTPFAHPTLTTVRQPVESISRRILDLVLALPQQQDAHEIRLEPTLIIGPSSPARLDAPMPP